MQKITRLVAIVLVVLAVVMAILAIGVGRRSAKPAATAPVAASTPARPVVVAQRPLEPGAVIPGDALRVAEVTAAPVDAYTRIDQVAGRVPAQAIPAGIAITSAVMARGLSLQLNPGERAIAVPVDELAGAGNRIAPGDYVDVFLNLGDARRAGNAEDPGQTRLLLSRVRVLGYGADDLDRRAEAASRAAADTPDAEAESEGTTGSRSGRRAAAIARRNPDEAGGSVNATARSAVLAVPVQDANALLLGAQSGKLFLALRNPIDEGQAQASLFPEPRKVLSPRKDLSETEKSAMQQPENQAFAGLDSAALAGRNTPAAKPAAAPTRRAAGASARTPGIEIIRGDGRTAPASHL